MSPAFFRATPTIVIRSTDQFSFLPLFTSAAETSSVHQRQTGYFPDEGDNEHTYFSACFCHSHDNHGSSYLRGLVVKLRRQNETAWGVSLASIIDTPGRWPPVSNSADETPVFLFRLWDTIYVEHETLLPSADSKETPPTLQVDWNPPVLVAIHTSRNWRSRGILWPEFSHVQVRLGKSSA